MSAFDVKKVKPKRLLFIVHREEILMKAKETFEKLLPNTAVSFGLFTGTRKDYEADYLFASIDSITRHYNKFEHSDFDYIIYDEANHVVAERYHRVIDYFESQYMLDMTEIPERGDSQY